MSQQIPAERILRNGLLASLIASLITGIGARIIMRIVALTAHVPLSFTIDGTFRIIGLAFLIGVIPGFAYTFCIFGLSSSTKTSKHLPGPIWRGLTFGVLILAICGLLSLLLPLLPPEDLSLGIPLLNKIMFAALPLIYGITLGGAEKIFDRFLLGEPVALTTETPSSPPQDEE